MPRPVACRCSAQTQTRRPPRRPPRARAGISRPVSGTMDAGPLARASNVMPGHLVLYSLHDQLETLPRARTAEGLAIGCVGADGRAGSDAQRRPGVARRTRGTGVTRCAAHEVRSPAGRSPARSGECAEIVICTALVCFLRLGLQALTRFLARGPLRPDQVTAAALVAAHTESRRASPLSYGLWLADYFWSEALPPRARISQACSRSGAAGGCPRPLPWPGTAPVCARIAAG